ncbi:immunity 22 family protein [Candidatus Njordibacter sp. Uisw_039]|jgi:hypothetical protein|uniref:immunity 22 family protein n=1 Tax=Candidatus Njordibacter sp. Uisw_039 TaxID=3230972 RepID=UPI003A310F30|tara:strand:+ start:128 stop:763 length:636 start_codon:yes stop_codon:yes gene_type:complete
MASSITSTDNTTLPSFEKGGKVSVWCSTVSYDTIPDSYFEEDDQGVDAWARNFIINEYDHENMETNGVASGTALVKNIIEDCSYSSAYGEGVVHKINKMGHQQVSWIILLFDFEYRNKITKIHEDEYVQYVGSFVYDMDSISLAEQDQLDAIHEEKLRLEALLILHTEAALVDTASELGLAPAVEPAPVSTAVEPRVEKVEPKGHNPWLKD